MSPTPPTSTQTVPPGATGFRETVRALLDLMRVRNPWGTFLLLLPSLWALTLAGGGAPDPKLVVIFTVGAFLMRSAGCIVNDIADRNIDPLVERTRHRPLADRRLSVTHAALAFAVLTVLAILLVAQLNRLTILLSAAGLALAVLYPFTKRFVAVPQAFLGMAFGWGTFMAWAAARNEIAIPPLLLFLATICWAVAYDTIYAIQDMDDDRRIGVKSSALLFGDAAWAWITGLLLATCLLVGGAGLMSGLSPLFAVGLLPVAGYFIRQGRKVKGGLTRTQAFALFAAHVWAGFFILAMMLVAGAV